jgi:hypothetical protein
MSLSDLVQVLDESDPSEVSLVAQRGEEYMAATSSTLLLAIALARTMALAGWVCTIRTDHGEPGDPGVVCTVQRHD